MKPVKLAKKVGAAVAVGLVTLGIIVGTASAGAASSGEFNGASSGEFNQASSGEFNTAGSSGEFN